MLSILIEFNTFNNYHVITSFFDRDCVGLSNM